MKQFALVLIILLTGLILYNLTNIDYTDLSSEANQQLYLRLVANVLVLFSLAFSYRRYTSKP